ncbi:MAG: flagellar export protein FliJ [Planctomycetota bacterium]
MADREPVRRFHFRLLPLLRLRSQLERQARRELAGATTVLQEVDRQLQAAAAGRRDFAERAAQGGSEATLARALADGLAARELRLLAQQRRAIVQFDAARSTWLGRARDHGTVKKLEERRRAEWRAGVAAAEQAEIDELGRLLRAVDADDPGASGGKR